MRRGPVTAVGAALVVVAAAALYADVYAQVRLWDLAELEAKLADYAWQLELVGLFRDGRIAGVHFTHVRGPLFSALLGAPAWLAGGTLARQIAAYEHAFHGLALFLSGLLACTYVRGAWRLVVAAWRSN